jgi:hypothetical protein
MSYVNISLRSQTGSSTNSDILYNYCWYIIYCNKYLNDFLQYISDIFFWQVSFALPNVFNLFTNWHSVRTILRLTPNIVTKIPCPCTCYTLCVAISYIGHLVKTWCWLQTFLEHLTQWLVPILKMILKNKCWCDLFIDSCGKIKYTFLFFQDLLQTLY